MNGSSSIRLSLGQIQLLKSLPINFSVHDTPCPTNQDIYIPHQDPPPLRFAKGDELRVETLVSLARSSPLLTGLSFRAVHWTPLKSAPVPLREGREFVGRGGTDPPTKKTPPNPRNSRPNTTRQASPPHEMRPNGRISGGVRGLVPPQKKSPNPSKERGMKGSVISAYQRVANMAYIERTMLISRMTYSRSY